MNISKQILIVSTLVLSANLLASNYYVTLSKKHYENSIIVNPIVPQVPSNSLYCEIKFDNMWFQQLTKNLLICSYLLTL
jgi:hypothetical protein